MRMHSRTHTVLALCAAVCLLPSCVRTVTKQPGFDTPDNQTFFKKINDCKLSLECLSPSRTFYAGQTVTLTFGLKNLDDKKITIFEWKAREADNLVLHYALAAAGQQRAPEKGWETLKAQPEGTVRRTALDLAPGNQVLVDVELGFVREMLLADGKPRTYWVYASLDLASVSCECPPFTIIVRP